VRIGAEWVTKVDVGGESDQKDVGDKRKAAFSDALKRAAVKFGISRYLYNLPGVWCDYDAKAKQLAKAPTLPIWALPRTTANGKNLPATGKELLVRLNKHEAHLVNEGRENVPVLVTFLRHGVSIFDTADLLLARRCMLH